MSIVRRLIPQGEPMGKPANILYVTGEHTKFSATSLSGNRHVPAGFTDRMATDGVAFANAVPTNSGSSGR